MKKTYDRKGFKQKLLSKRKTVAMVIRLLIVLLLGCPLLARAGTRDSTRLEGYRVQGTVVDEKGIPLPGVTVRLDSTMLGVTTDNEGKFLLRLPQVRGVLVFSFVGYKTVKMKFEPDKPLYVRMKEDISELDEVTVVAYGEQSRRDVIGAMSTVKAADIKDIPSPSHTLNSSSSVDNNIAAFSNTEPRNGILSSAP